MSRYRGQLACVRCGARTPDDSPWTGCATCRREGVNANVLPVYDLTGSERVGPRPEQPGIFRYRDLLPLADDTVPVSLEEGATPVIASEQLATEVGVGQLWFKDETRNPTWSYKDRLAAVAITNARERGAHTVALATTGNHGAAAAAYAAAAGLRCVALTLESVPLTMKVLMQSYGAEVVALRTGPERWELLSQAVGTWGWVPVSGFVNPPIGSNPFGVDGYKTIAYELQDQLDRLPDAVVVPTAYADGLTGVERGFRDLVEIGVVDRAPRMIAADPFGAYADTLGGGSDAPVRVPAGPTVAFSIGTPIGTWQGMQALRRSGGAAAGEPDDETTMAAQRRIATTTGLFLEASAALCLPVIQKLVKGGVLGSQDRVLCLATSTGLKDVGAAARRLPPVPVIDADLDRLAAVVEGDHR